MSTGPLPVGAGNTATGGGVLVLSGDGGGMSQVGVAPAINATGADTASSSASRTTTTSPASTLPISRPPESRARPTIAHCTSSLPLLAAGLVSAAQREQGRHLTHAADRGAPTSAAG